MKRDFGAMTDEELLAEEERLAPEYAKLSRRRAIEGKREVDLECRRVDEELWQVRREMRTRGWKG